MHHYNNGRALDKNFTSVTVVDPELDFDLSGTSRPPPQLTGPIHPFHHKKNSLIQRTTSAVRTIARTNQRCLLMAVANLLVLVFTKYYLLSTTTSIAMDAFILLIVFDLMTCVVSIISTFHEKVKGEQSDQLITANYQRIHTLLVFSSLIFTMVGAVFIYKECFVRSMEDPSNLRAVSSGSLIPSAVLLFTFHIVKTVGVEVKPLRALCQASSSSVIQEHLADMSTSLCSAVPSLTRLLLPRLDPFLVMTSLSLVVISISHLLHNSFIYADVCGGLTIATLIICSMWPLATCSGRILLNTLPAYVIGQLDKLLSEAQTLDGVLEIRKEKFHAIALSADHKSYGLMLFGSIDVRIRRDANPQMVLAHVYNKISPLVHQLTIQVIRDEWQLPQTPTIPQKSASQLSTSSSKKPTAKVAPYQRSSHDNHHHHHHHQHAHATSPSHDAFQFKSTLTSSSYSTPVTPAASANSSQAGDVIAKMYRNAGFTKAPPRGDQLKNLTSYKFKPLGGGVSHNFSDLR